MIGNAKGVTGENIACRSLEKNGYIIRERNYRSAYGEIDIIAEKDGVMAFVEVKLRKKGSRVSGLESVSQSKQAKIIRTAMVYIGEKDCLLQPRFDVVSVVEYREDEFGVQHFENAFDAQNVPDIF